MNVSKQLFINRPHIDYHLFLTLINSNTFLFSYFILNCAVSEIKLLRFFHEFIYLYFSYLYFSILSILIYTFISHTFLFQSEIQGTKREETMIDLDN